MPERFEMPAICCQSARIYRSQNKLDDSWRIEKEKGVGKKAGNRKEEK